MPDDPALRAGRRQRAVDRQLGHQPLALETVAEPFDEKLAQRVELVRGDREAGRHRMAAAIDQESGLARRDDRWPERQPRHRAARPFADTISEGDDAGRPLVAFLEPRRDDADDPGMPPLSRGEHQRRRLRRALDQRDRCLQRARLDLAPLAVVAVEPLRQLGGERRVVGRQQARAKIGGADPAAGIDPRPQHETELIRVDGPVFGGNGGECLEAGVGRVPRHSQTLRDEGAVDARQWHHIAHRAERDEIEPLQQIGLGTVAVPSGLAQGAVQRDHQQISDANRREHAVRAFLVEPVRIDHRQRARQ